MNKVQASLQQVQSDLSTVGFDPEVVGSKNCENMIGSVEIPIGLAGPVTVNVAASPYQNKRNQKHQYTIPLATTEGALVASTNRGCKALRESGEVTVLLKHVGMTRAPVFKCASGSVAYDFMQWLDSPDVVSQIKSTCEATSNHLTYVSHMSWVRGRHVYTRFVFDTDQAMGMNMVTIALQKSMPFILQEYRKQKNTHVELLSLSSNVCTDKKDSIINALLGRGYWVQAEAFLDFEILSSVLKLDTQSKIDSFVDNHIAKNLVGSNIAGSHSQNMHAANVIAAFFAATGQDLAHVAEASQGFTSIEKTDSGVYVAVTLPDVPVGTVGGGTQLPHQKQARSFILAHDKVVSADLASAVGVGVLAAEISGLAALTTQTLAQAHAKLGR